LLNIFFNIQLVDPKKDIEQYERQMISLKRKLYDLGWSRIVIKHDSNLIYFDTFNTHWKLLSKRQRQWLYNAAIHGVNITGYKIIPNDEIRSNPYKLQFGNAPSDGYIEPDDII